MSDLDEIGRNIVLLRKAQGLTQEQVAFQTNISVSRLQEIEYGCQSMTINTLINLSNTLQVDSRILGIFSKADKEILSEIHSSFWLPGQMNGPFQICDNILRLRKMQNLTQKQLAEMSNVSVSRLRDIEHKCANMTTGKLINIAEAFGITLVELNAISMSNREFMNLVHKARIMAGMEL